MYKSAIKIVIFIREILIPVLLGDRSKHDQSKSLGKLLKSLLKY